MGKTERPYIRAYTVLPLENVTLSEYRNVCHVSADVPVLNFLRPEQFLYIRTLNLNLILETGGMIV